MWRALMTFKRHADIGLLKRLNHAQRIIAQNFTFGHRKVNGRSPNHIRI